MIQENPAMFACLNVTIGNGAHIGQLSVLQPVNSFFTISVHHGLECEFG